MTRLVTLVVAALLFCAAPGAASPLDDYARTTWASLAATTDPPTGPPAHSPHGHRTAGGRPRRERHDLRADVGHQHRRLPVERGRRPAAGDHLPPRARL